MPDFLTNKERDSLNDDDFALPGRVYPIHNENHARSTLTKVNKLGSERDKTIVRFKIKSKYPNIEVGS